MASTTTTAPESYDVIVVGSGNAGLSAAASAAQTLRAAGASAPRILVLEKAPEQWRGGNSTFTAGAYRTVFHGLEDVLPLVTNVADEQKGKIDMAPYSEADFRGDLMRVTGGRADKALADVLVGRSRETTRWLGEECGVRFVLSFHRQAYVVQGRQKFWGGMVLAVEEGGKGLTRMHLENVARLGVEVRYQSAVVDVLGDEAGAATGVRVVDGKTGRTYELHARGGVVLAAGGFEANPQMRAQHIGPSWDQAYVRGTPYNTGDLLSLLLSPSPSTTAPGRTPLRALPYGNWSGCHSTCWDFSAPPHRGDLQLTNQFTKSGYPLGVMVNSAGARFVNEGEDLRNFTYARFGRAVLAQPESVAFQVWDAEGAKWLRKEEYAEDVVERVQADTLEELADKLADGRGLSDTAAFLTTLKTYNAAATAFREHNPHAPFDPSIKDGISTISPTNPGPSPPKTNWALPITQPPFLAVKITCGITFTFGGLAADAETAGVKSAWRTGEDGHEATIPGLYVAGEMLGGLFWGNYPGGSGLTAGAVFGRIAGREAASRAVRARGK